VRDLYKGQCNDPYWHGVFGGLYLPHLREAAYHHLLEAEKRTPDPADWRAFDLDCDGRDELVYRDGTFGLVARPPAGGSLAEIDYRPWGRNLTDVLGRRREAYHRASEEAGEGAGKSIHELGKTLPPEAAELARPDWHPRLSLIDHFFRPGTTPEEFRRVDYAEQGDFVLGPFSAEIAGRTLRLARRGAVWAGPERVPVAVRKTVTAAGGALRAEIEIENLADRPLSVLYGSEWNLLAFPHECELAGPAGASLYGGALVFEPERADAVWSFPLRTLSQSEEGFDIIHQGYCFCPIWSAELAGNAIVRLSVVLKERHGR
jgi:hypothetical protein